MQLKLAIVGRPNVGKSTLFNRLAGKKLALVDNQPGVTRDRREADGEIMGLKLKLIDTAGFEDVHGPELETRMRQQTEAAIALADVVLFLVDARTGITPLDRTFAELLRKSQKPVIVAANKCEGRAAEPGHLEAYELGLGEPIALSAEHALGLYELWEALSAASPHAPEEDPPADEEKHKRPLRIAIVGRPNVGKSTLINTLLGEDRLITGPEAGITRDSIAVPFVHSGREIALYDTAGMRKRGRVNEKLEQLSVGDTLLAIRFADVVVVMMDATEPFDVQDLKIADLIEREGRAIVIVFNKWDLIENRRGLQQQLTDETTRRLAQMRGVPIVTLSGLTGEGVGLLMKAVFSAEEVWTKRVSTSPLNRWLEGAIERHPPPVVKSRRIKLKYITQVKARPPTFIIFTQRASELPGDYLRYLSTGIRETFEFPGVPIRIELRQRGNPYADD